MDASQTNATRRKVIDTNTQQVAKVYAKALFGAAQNAGQTEAVLGELKSLISELFDPHPRLEAMLGSHRMASDDGQAILDRVIGDRVSKLVLNFLKVLIKHERLNCLRAVRDEYYDLYEAARGHVIVDVFSAVAISEDQAGKLRDDLKHKLGAEPDLVFHVQPELLGGLVVRVGDTVYDGSVSTQLERVREQMLNRSVHEIQSRRDSFGYSEGN